jgi:hypothetical protein
MSPRRLPGPDAPARLRRAATFAATSAALASLAHAVGGAALPDLWLLGLGAAAVAAAAYPLLGREAGWPRIIVGLAMAQAALHGYLSMAAGHAHHGAHSSQGDGAAMLWAHILATGAAAVWLRLAEGRLWQQARQSWVRALLRPHALLAAPVLHRPPEQPAPSGPLRRLIAAPGAPRWGVRGPPLLVGP